MSRCEALERILALWYELDHCDPEERLTIKHRFDLEIIALLKETGHGRDEFLAAVHGRYTEYRRQRRAEERRRLNRGIR